MAILKLQKKLKKLDFMKYMVFLLLLFSLLFGIIDGKEMRFGGCVYKSGIRTKTNC